MKPKDRSLLSRRGALASVAAAVGAANAGAQPLPATDATAAELRAAETGFAATMARRDKDAFAAYIADDAIFINQGQPLRGRDAIVKHWARFFVEPSAPFSWKPEIVEVAASLALGYTEGPVSSPSGVVFARFYTTWQKQAGRWRVVFDNGYTVCAAPA